MSRFHHFPLCLSFCVSGMPLVPGAFVAAGKPRRIAIAACVRKLLNITNAIVRKGQPWGSIERRDLEAQGLPVYQGQFDSESDKSRHESPAHPVENTRARKNPLTNICRKDAVHRRLSRFTRIACQITSLLERAGPVIATSMWNSMPSVQPKAATMDARTPRDKAAATVTSAPFRAERRRSAK